MYKPKFSIVMATVNDFDGLWMTVHSLRMYHGDLLRDRKAEIVVVDNGSPKHILEAEAGVVLGYPTPAAGGIQCRIISAPEVQGTAAPRERAIKEAQGKYVLCMDGHIIFPHGSLESLFDYFDAHPDTADLIHGPLLHDNHIDYSTHFQPTWGGEMFGQWAFDKEQFDKGEAFEIPGCGLGVFAFRKDAWLGFNPLFRGFGGEEMYIHEKFRQAGHKTLCLPKFLWQHKFRPAGVSIPYRLSNWDKCRNYIVGRKELGLPLDDVYEHFVKAGKIHQQHWDAILAGTVEEPGLAMTAIAPCSTCGSNNAEPPALSELYQKAAATPSDINEHAETLRSYAEKGEVVVEYGTRHGVSTVALLAGKPKELISVDVNHSAEAAVLEKVAVKEGVTKFTFLVRSSTDYEPPEHDVLFIDTLHRAAQVWSELSYGAAKCRKYIILHDTEIFGEIGDDNGPGILPAVRKYLREHPEWIVKEHFPNNHGLTVLSRLEEDKPKIEPGIFKQLATYAKAKYQFLKNGSKVLPDSEVEKRLDICALCPSRSGERCSKCGCPLVDGTDGGPGKAYYREEDGGVCPLGKWPVPLPVVK